MCSKRIFCSKVAQKGKFCPRLLEPQKVAPDAKSCSKVAEHNREKPIGDVDLGCVSSLKFKIMQIKNQIIRIFR